VNDLRRLLRYARPYRGRVALAIGAMVVYAIGQAEVALLIQVVMDGLIAARTSGSAALLSSTGIAIAKPVIIYSIPVTILLAYLCKGLGAYVSSFLMADAGQRVVRDLRNALYGHILGQSAAFFSTRTSGQLVSRVTNDVNQVQTAVSETFADLARESLAVVALGGVLVSLDWRLALVVFVSAPLAVYPLARLGQRVRRSTRRGQEELEHVTHVATEGLAGHRIVKAFGAEGREIARFSRATEMLYRTNMRIMSAVAALPPLMEFIGGLAIVGALWYGMRQIGRGVLSPGDFTSFLAAAVMMYGPIKKLSRINASIQQTIAACERIFAMLDTHTEVLEKPGALALPRMSRTVEFRDVGFRYEGSAGFQLRNASFTVHAGQVVALVGLSGAVTSTMSASRQS
jgi:subfamily B ATP-binding cassette protein MsbA